MMVPIFKELFLKIPRVDGAKAISGQTLARQSYRSNYLPFRITPAGFLDGAQFLLPRVARMFAGLTFSPPWAGLGMYLRHGREQNKKGPS